MWRNGLSPFTELVMWALGLVLACALVAALFGCSEQTVGIDTGNEKLMHELGLPTKADVEMWREVGRWGYSTENVMHTEHVYTQLPGNPNAWYRLYGIGENDG